MKVHYFPMQSTDCLKFMQYYDFNRNKLYKMKFLKFYELDVRPDIEYFL